MPEKNTRNALNRESLVYRQPRVISRICTPRHSIYNCVLSGFQASLSEQSTSLGESLGRSNQGGSNTSQACYSHPRCNLNLFRLFRLFSSSAGARTPFPLFFVHAAINLQPLHVLCCTIPQGQVRRCSSLPRCQIPDDPLSRRPSFLFPSPRLLD